MMSDQSASEAIEMVAYSDTGRVRCNNEDSVCANARHGFALLADGMGGHNAGEVASAMATATIAAALEQPPIEAWQAEQAAAVDPAFVKACLGAAIANANHAVYSASCRQPDYAGMGTTIVALQWFAGQYILAHIGDSRCYRLRGAELKLLTRDHSFVQQRIDQGLLAHDKARAAPGRHMLTRALGTSAAVTPDFRSGATTPGDLFLLCSDGLSDMVDEADIAITLEDHSAALKQRAERLVALANRNGGRDNISVILVLVKRHAAERHAARRRQGG